MQRLWTATMIALIVCGTATISWGQSFKSPKQIHQLLQEGVPLNAAKSQALREAIEKKYAKDDLSKGEQNVWIEKNDQGGGTVVWAFRHPQAKTVTIRAERERQWPMQKLEGSDLWVASAEFPNFSSCHFRYEIDGGKRIAGKRFGFESFPLTHPDSHEQADVPKAELIDMGTHVSKKHFPGAERQWWIYVPVQYKQAPDKPASLIVFNDGGGFCKGAGNACTVLDNLIHKKQLPVTIAVFVNPGTFPATKPGAQPRSNRSDEYDTCTPRYATFLDEEILSIVREKYKLSDDPWEHAICGSSSGASCAFTAAWHRNDLFRRVISFIGSYCDFRPVGSYPIYREEGFLLESNQFGQWKTAHDYPGLIRKTEPRKEIRVVLQDGKNDLDNTLGNWFLNNERMDAALSYAGYEHIFIIGEGFHSSQHGKSILPEVLTWVWQDKGQ